jgi:hypothetical protein
VLGEAVGQAYVDRTFSPAAKARAKAIVENMVAVLGDQIQQLGVAAAAMLGIGVEQRFERAADPAQQSVRIGH